jgi:two-component system, OmpR family, KDP operon response regulator KdpE
MKLRHKVLVVDDELHIRRLIRAALERADYAIVEAENAREAVAKLRDERPDITLLDLGLPDRDGLELVPLFKQQSGTTLIVVSARGRELSPPPVYSTTKPFDTDELLARVRVALRNRLTRDGGNLGLTVGDVQLDLVARTVTKAGREVHLTPKEYGVLAQLARFPGRVITHKQIMAEVWPHEHEHHVEYLRVLIRTLRQKLETDPQQPQIITNELGIGYRLRVNGEGGDRGH